MSTQAITQIDLETQMLKICDAIEAEIDCLKKLSDQRAEAESEYKYKQARSMVNQTTKIPIATKEAVAHLHAQEDFRLWKILEAREKATQQALIGLRSRLDALRTICANVRAAGG